MCESIMYQEADVIKMRRAKEFLTSIEIPSNRYHSEKTQRTQQFMNNLEIPSNRYHEPRQNMRVKEVCSV